MILGGHLTSPIIHSVIHSLTHSFVDLAGPYLNPHYCRHWYTAPYTHSSILPVSSQSCPGTSYYKPSVQMRAQFNTQDGEPALESLFSTRSTPQDQTLTPRCWAKLMPTLPNNTHKENAHKQLIHSYGLHAAELLTR